jgi:hypothetical protein
MDHISRPEEDPENYDPDKGWQSGLMKGVVVLLLCAGAYFLYRYWAT